MKYRYLHLDSGKSLKLIVPTFGMNLVLRFAHYDRMEDNPGRKTRFERLHEPYFCSSMVTDVATTIFNLDECARNQVLIKLKTNTMNLLPATNT